MRRFVCLHFEYRNLAYMCTSRAVNRSFRYSRLSINQLPIIPYWGYGKCNAFWSIGCFGNFHITDMSICVICLKNVQIPEGPNKYFTNNRNLWYSNSRNLNILFCCIRIIESTVYQFYKTDDARPQKLMAIENTRFEQFVTNQITFDSCKR